AVVRLGAPAPQGERWLARGIVDRIGSHSTIDFSAGHTAHVREAAAVADHGEAINRVLAWLDSSGALEGRGLSGVGHRVVHGGSRFVEPTLIDEHVIDAIETAGELAPLHNRPALNAIRAARAMAGTGVPMVAVFDTAFHNTMPQAAALYAIPPELASRHRIRRYGFHGLAHRYMAERYAAATSTPAATTRLVTLHLGNGCSATAIEGGRSVDTSMGFTPLEGLVMGTRSGDIDPSVLGYLARSEGVDFAEVEEWLNTRSGLLGLSGRSRDMRELLEAESAGDAAAALAIDMFCYRARKYVGAYLAVLHGADAVLFGGGIGENAPAVRARICAGLEWCGLRLDRERNSSTVGTEGRITADDAPVHACVVPVDEASVIVSDTAGCLRGRRFPGPATRK
ncbi:MAG: acetate/propionate family kinase, partial [Chloroflexota bacterium]|nr:acetate/propionate family kinase [Chloroflexota bacterium]